MIRKVGNWSAGFREIQSRNVDEWSKCFRAGSRELQVKRLEADVVMP